MAGYTKWLDEDPELMKQIPSEEERVACIWVRYIRNTPFSILLGFVTFVLVSLFWTGRHGPFLDWGRGWRIATLICFLLFMLWAAFSGDYDKAHVDIYPNMFVWYDYDQYSKKARPSQFYYWADIVQYNAAEPYIWLESKDTDPVRIWGDMAKLRPYFEQYAPHAEVVRFDMHRYFDKQLDKYNAEKKAARKAAKKQDKDT